MLFRSLAQQPSQLYEQIHAAFIAELSERGIRIARRGHTSGGPNEPFLCFLREAAPDLVVQGHKVLGSAQRRRRGAVLQHGSLLLRASEHVPEISGLCDVAPPFLESTIVTADLAERLARCLGERSSLRGLDEPVRSKANELSRRRSGLS